MLPVVPLPVVSTGLADTDADGDMQAPKQFGLGTGLDWGVGETLEEDDEEELELESEDELEDEDEEELELEVAEQISPT